MTIDERTTWRYEAQAHGQAAYVERRERTSDYVLRGRPVVAVSYRLECSCGHVSNIATTSNEYATNAVTTHLHAHRELTADEIFDLLA